MALAAPHRDPAVSTISSSRMQVLPSTLPMMFMTQITALSEYAKKNNIALDDTATASIDSQMQTLAAQATKNGYTSVKNYLIKAYGRGCSEALVRGELERYTLASKAYTSMAMNCKIRPP